MPKSSFGSGVHRQRKSVEEPCEAFNTVFETTLRIILLTSSSPKMFFTSDRILALDFINCYAKAFGLSSENLHGNNDFMYGEIARRRFLVIEAVKKLVRKGILQVQSDHGYQYKITMYGLALSDNFFSTYAQDYRRVAKVSVEKYDCKSDEQLLIEIQNQSCI